MRGTAPLGNPTAQTLRKFPPPPMCPDQGQGRGGGGGKRGGRRKGGGEREGRKREGLKASEAGREKGAGEGRGTRQDPASRQNGALGVAVRDLPARRLGSGLGWAGLEHSPTTRHHQLHLHFVGNNDAQDLPVGSFPQPARRRREAGSWVL